VADDGIEAPGENLGEAGALLVGFDFRVERGDVVGQARLLEHVVIGVLVGLADVFRIEAEPVGEPPEEMGGMLRGDLEHSAHFLRRNAPG